MLRDATVQPMLPVKDMDAATKFYAETLGLERVGGEPGVAVTYRTGSSTLCVYRSEFAGTNRGTAALWELDDVEGTAKHVPRRGGCMSSHDDANPARASFTSMEASTADDWRIIATQFLPYAGALPDRILGHLRLLEGDCGGFAVDRLMHSLQTATR